MMLHQRRHVDVGQRVAVDDQQFVFRHERERPARTAARSQKRRFPRIADTQTKRTPVADDGRDGFGTMVQIHDGVGDARLPQPAQDVRDERLSTQRHRRFGKTRGEWLEPDAKASREDQRGRKGRHGRAVGGAVLFVEQHVSVRQSAGAAVLDEEAPVRIEHVVLLAQTQQARDIRDALLTPFDLDEHADGRLVDCEHHVGQRVLLAILLIAEPHA